MFAAWHVTITRTDVTLAIAVFGAGLGIWNAWTGWRRDRISLTVIPKLYRMMPGGVLSWSDTAYQDDSPTDRAAKLCVEIRNNSRCAVTIDEVGFYRRRASTRFVLVQHFLSEEKGKLPFRLEPFSSITVYALYPLDAMPSERKAVKYAYAETGHGDWFEGTSPILKKLIRQNFRWE